MPPRPAIPVVRTTGISDCFPVTGDRQVGGRCHGFDVEQARGAPNAEPQGYSLELCRAIAAKLKEQLKIPDLKVTYVPVDTTNRFEAIKDNKADLLCEGATATLSRRKIVDFSLPIFIDGASFVIRPDGPRDLKFLAGKKVGVLPDCCHPERSEGPLLANLVGGTTPRTMPSPLSARLHNN